ncbi:putative F-box domain, leucine-rich repeat domain superfamily [Helianthus annuus]|nr:putative F-box domain, leucine-rich repeat domain superfamily [Helianthus annuus]KAJ0440665.1 putative F-box domain, leucine-rich repeat domain superfamily [Helianthus annuus]
MDRNYDELPEEIWELILHRLSGDHDIHHQQLESLSSVSKRLLSLTDRLRRRFTVVDQTYIIHGTISRFIYRFKNLKTLDLSKLKNCYVETAIREIARSSVALNLESVDVSNHNSVPIEGLKELGLSNRRIKVLRCANVDKLRDVDLIDIARYFPDLEELDVSYPRNKFEIDALRRYSISEIMITDAGIEGLCCGLRNLVKINISMNPLLTDRSLVNLSSKCLRLQEITMLKCIMITMKGVRFMLHNSPNLRSVSMCLISNIHGTDSLFVDATSGRCLSELHFSDSDISDEFLDSIVKARVPLKSVCFSDSGSYSIDGLLRFLHAYHSLKFLDLSKSYQLCDSSIVDLSRYFRDLVSIKLNSCHKLTHTSLFALIINCPFLEHVEMEHASLGKEEDLNTIINVLYNVHTKSSSMKSLNLGWNSHLTDECLSKITSICPNLTQLDVSSCSGITRSIGEVLKSCPKIEHLSIQDCGGVKNIGLNMLPLRLKKLNMARSGVNDEGLVGIAVRCNDLVKIDLEGCQHVTTSAVKFMVKNCEKLREVNLMGCPNLHVYIVDWMVHTRPSLRKLVPPSYAVTSESQRQLILRHGCQVCDK